MTDDKYTSRTENVGQFRCETTYARSEEKTFTDLSASYGGREKYPTPGMLLGATLSSCMMSLLSVIAARKEVDLRGMRILAHAVESEKGIEKIELKAVMPLDGSHPLRSMLEKAAMTCPVRRALHPDLVSFSEYHPRNCSGSRCFRSGSWNRCGCPRSPP